MITRMPAAKLPANNVIMNRTNNAALAQYSLLRKLTLMMTGLRSIGAQAQADAQGRDA